MRKCYKGILVRAMGGGGIQKKLERNRRNTGERACVSAGRGGGYDGNNGVRKETKNHGRIEKITARDHGQKPIGELVEAVSR